MEKSHKNMLKHQKRLCKLVNGFKAHGCWLKYTTPAFSGVTDDYGSVLSSFNIILATLPKSKKLKLFGFNHYLEELNINKWSH